MGAVKHYQTVVRRDFKVLVFDFYRMWKLRKKGADSEGSSGDAQYRASRASRAERAMQDYFDLQYGEVEE